MIALLAALALQSDTLGKTNAQILAMGFHAWYKLYVGKQGESTAGMTSAIGLYADALSERNDRLVGGLRPMDRTRYGRLRKAMTDFTGAATGVGSSITGGGTMWNPIGAEQYRVAEEAFYGVLTHRSKAPPRVVSDVTKEVARLKARVATLDGSDHRQGDASMKDLQAAFARILVDLRAASRRESDTVLELCRSTLQNIREAAGPN